MQNSPTRNILFVTGENTEVGKTFVTSAMINALRERGHDVAARKPLQSYSPGETTDAELLAEASGEPAGAVNKWSYQIPMAPPMAGSLLGEAVPTTETVADFLQGCENDRCFAAVEGVGGPYSPLAIDGDSLSLIGSLNPKTVLAVIRSGLGAINAALLCLNALSAPNIILHFNRFDQTDLVQKMNLEFMSNAISADNGSFPRRNSEERNVYLTTDIRQLVVACENIFPGCHKIN